MYYTGNFGRIVRERREKMGMTISVTAELCDLSIKGLERIELGDSNPKLATVFKIAQVLNIDLGDLNIYR